MIRNQEIHPRVLEKGMHDMKTLVILAHPNMETSRVNRRWKMELEQFPEQVRIHELYEAYSDWDINVAREQELLEAHDHVILQFPFYWYSYPPLLKNGWMTCSRMDGPTVQGQPITWEADGACHNDWG